MPSQEEYLDNLLRGVTGDTSGATKEPVMEPETEPVMEPETEPAIEPVIEEEVVEPFTEQVDSFDGENLERTDVDDIFKDIGMDMDEPTEEDETTELEAAPTVEETSKLSEEEIEQLLMAGQVVPQSEQSTVDVGDDDLMKMLEDAPDEELNQIHDMLHKADNNEAVDEGILSLLQPDAEEVFDPLAEEDSANSEETEKEQQILEKKRLREEKKAARAQRREEKKAQSAARKAERKAARAFKKNANPIEENPKEEDDGIHFEDDFSDLDHIIENSEDFSEVENEEQPENISDVESVENISSVDSMDLVSDIPEVESMDTVAGDEDAPVELDNVVDDADIMELLQFADGVTGESFFPLEDLEGLEKAEGQDGTAETENTDKLAKKEKKKSAFAKILDFLTEEEEEPEPNTEIQLSDENQNILDELDNEKDKKGKKKNKKGKKGKKGEDAADAKESEEGSENTEGGDKEDKKGKKAKKPKKEKPSKALRKLKTEEPENVGSKLSFKRMLPILLVCVALGIALFTLTNLAGTYSVKKAGREAYYNGDYQTCYENLFGKDLTESEQVMYSKSESILRIRLWIREYEMFAEEGQELQALDSLIQSVKDYPLLYDYAAQWNAGSEVAQLYQQILDILSDKYQLSEAQAQEIANVPEDIEYTRRVDMIVQGKGFGAWEKPQETENAQPEELPDLLPEEEELSEVPFIDNN